VPLTQGRFLAWKVGWFTPCRRHPGWLHVWLGHAMPQESRVVAHMAGRAGPEDGLLDGWLSRPIGWPSMASLRGRRRGERCALGDVPGDARGVGKHALAPRRHQQSSARAPTPCKPRASFMLMRLYAATVAQHAHTKSCMQLMLLACRVHTNFCTHPHYLRRYSYENAPIQKELSAREVGNAAAFLLSPLASAITGQVRFHMTYGLAHPRMHVCVNARCWCKSGSFCGCWLSFFGLGPIPS